MTASIQSFLRFALLTVTGVLCSRVAESYLFPIEWGGFRASLGHVGLLLLTIAATPLFARPAPEFFWFVLAIVCDQAVYLVVAPQGLGFYSAPSVIGSAVMITLLLLSRGALAAGHPEAASVAGSPSAIGPRTRFAVLGGVFAVVALSRIVHILGVQAGIPNEGRSMMIAGFEVHHINVGVMLVWVAALLREGRPSTRATVPLVMVTLTVGLGLVVDQMSFYALREAEDIAYGGPISLFGALLGVALITVMLRFASGNWALNTRAAD